MNIFLSDFFSNTLDYFFRTDFLKLNETNIFKVYVATLFPYSF